MQEYEALEREIPYENGTAGDRENLAKVHHNRGVLLTQLFLFEEAAEEFMNSYRISGSEESYVEYLLAMRMYCPQEQYLAYISEHEEAYRYWQRNGSVAWKKSGRKAKLCRDWKICGS